MRSRFNQTRRGKIIKRFLNVFVTIVMIVSLVSVSVADSIRVPMRLLDEGQSYTQVSKSTGISKSTLIRRRREQKAVADVDA